MIQTVKIGSEVIVLDSEKKYTGKDNPSEEEKMVRKAVGLPVKKQLIYYTNKHDANSAVNVVSHVNSIARGLSVLPSDHCKK